MDYLNDYPPASNTRILEIGCGWGLTSIYCTKKFGCKVTGVDADEDVFPYLEAHAKLNGTKIKTFVTLKIVWTVAIPLPTWLYVSSTFTISTTRTSGRAAPSEDVGGRSGRFEGVFGAGATLGEAGAI